MSPGIRWARRQTTSAGNWLAGEFDDLPGSIIAVPLAVCLAAGALVWIVAAWLAGIAWSAVAEIARTRK